MKFGNTNWPINFIEGSRKVDVKNICLSVDNGISLESKSVVVDLADLNPSRSTNTTFLKTGVNLFVMMYSNIWSCIELPESLNNLWVFIF